MLAAAAALLAAPPSGAWYGLDEALGRSLAAQIASVGVAIGAGWRSTRAACGCSGVKEARQIRALLPFGRG